ncbi:terminase [Enterobacter asburiae]|uniref:terminase n=1 Tax=Enterobacter asburiae TaxID=61645 RepID=UPI002FD2F5EB
MATKKKVGRPSRYKKEYAEQARKLCLLGYTDAELADFFEVAESTINKWKKDHPEFSESIKKGKSVADGEVASKLFHRATGYEHPEDDIRAVEGKIVITPTVKHYPPDTAAAIFWLKNRQGKKWRDKQDINHLSEDGSMTPRGLNDFYATIEAESQSGTETILEDEGKE